MFCLLVVLRKSFHDEEIISTKPLSPKSAYDFFGFMYFSLFYCGFVMSPGPTQYTIYICYSKVVKSVK